MVFNKGKRIAFVFPPKTGSISTGSFLKSIGWKSLPYKHLETKIYLDELPNLNNYTIYGFLRNPLARFESAILHLKRDSEIDDFVHIIESNGKHVETVSYDEIVDLFPAIIQKLPIFLGLQSKWLSHPKVTVLDFDNLESELRRITGDTTTPMPTYNVSDGFGKSVITDKVRAFVREYYAADYALAKDRLGKEYNP